MSFSQFVRKRSGAEWRARGLLAAAVLVAGCFSVLQTLGYVLKEKADAAHALAPGEGRITGRLSQKLFVTKPTARDRTRAKSLARVALRQDATSVWAAVALGLNAQLDGNVQEARRIFRYANALSRRELLIQLWAIEDAIDRKDLEDVLVQYDIALRTSPGSSELLFPLLASAISDPLVRTALVNIFSGNPGWRASFINYAVVSANDPRATIDLLREVRKAGGTVSEEADSLLLRALVANGFLDEAWSYYASVRKGVDRRRSRDEHFAGRIDPPSPFDWVPINEGGVTSSFEKGEEGGFLDFVAPSSIGGPVVQQMQMLPAGAYRLSGFSIGVDQPDETLPYWILRCGSGRELGRVELRNSADAKTFFSGRLKVPTECPNQILMLVVRPSSDVLGVAGRIGWIELRPSE